MQSNSFELTVPVVLVMFNRPKCVEKVFEKIREAKPRELYIIADGPREGYSEDVALCEECRNIVADVDWECKIYKNYSDINLGCGLRPATGFSWVFDHTEEAIILEDDCVPSIDFFQFCQEMLNKFRYDERIYSVSGMNFDFFSDNNADYYFTSYNNTWGWATWRRVWKLYDYEMRALPDFKKNHILQDLILEPAFVHYWYRCFDIVYQKKLTTAWDYQFTFCSFCGKGLHIYPQKNLVSYIGFDDMATHTTSIDKSHRLYTSTRETQELSFPLRHPSLIQTDFRIDYLIMKEIFGVKTGNRLFQWDISEEILNMIKNNQRLFLYGAGNVCREVIQSLGRHKIDRFQVIVTQKQEKQYIMGNLIHSIDGFHYDEVGTMVIVAAGGKNREEMVNNLKIRKCYQFLSVYDNDYQKAYADAKKDGIYKV